MIYSAKRRRICDIRFDGNKTGYSLPAFAAQAGTCGDKIAVLGLAKVNRRNEKASLVLLISQKDYY